VRLLCGRRFDDDVLEVPVFAVVRKALFRGPRLKDEREPFLESFVRLLHRDTEAGEFVVAVPFTDPEFEPTVRHELCHGNTITAVPSLKVDVRAATHVKRLRLADTCPNPVK
jgi:hypothetical protein